MNYESSPNTAGMKEGIQPERKEKKKLSTHIIQYKKKLTYVCNNMHQSGGSLSLPVVVVTVLGRRWRFFFSLKSGNGAIHSPTLCMSSKLANG